MMQRGLFLKVSPDNEISGWAQPVVEAHAGPRQWPKCMPRQGLPSMAEFQRLERRLCRREAMPSPVWPDDAW